MKTNITKEAKIDLMVERVYHVFIIVTIIGVIYTAITLPSI